MPEKKKPETAAAPEPAKEIEAGGKAWQISPEAMDDFELLEDLGRWDDGDVSRMPIIIRRLLGDEQLRRAMDAIRDGKTGRVSMESGAQFVNDLLAGLNPN